LNTFVGVLDAAFWLSDVEQYNVTGILNRLLTSLRIPERGDPLELPPAIALEVESGFYTIGLAGPRDSNIERPVRAINQRDTMVSVETWRDALLGMLLTAYPNLEPTERLVTATVLDDMLAALGVPMRAASAYPDTVLRAFQQSPDAL
jgi:hypothetical protein